MVAIPTRESSHCIPSVYVDCSRSTSYWGFCLGCEIISPKIMLPGLSHRTQKYILFSWTIGRNYSGKENNWPHACIDHRCHGTTEPIQLGGWKGFQKNVKTLSLKNSFWLSCALQAEKERGSHFPRENRFTARAPGAREGRSRPFVLITFPILW